MKRPSLGPSVFLLISSTIIVSVYLSSLSNDFLWLDHTDILRGARIIKSWGDLASTIFSNDRGYLGYHRPFNNILYTLNFLLWGSNPFGYHLVSLIMHVTNLILVWSIQKRAGISSLQRSAVCLVWGLHPVNTVAVGLIHNQADLFMMTMLCATILFLVNKKSTERKHEKKRFIAAYVFFCVALLTKETAFMFPFCFFIIVLLSSNITKRAIPTSWLIVSFITCLVVFIPRLSMTNSYRSDIGFVERLLTFITVYNDYFIKILLPKKLFVGDTVTRFFALDLFSQIKSIVIGIVLLSIQMWYFIKQPRSRPWLLVWNVSLIPVSQIIPILHFRADRFLYLPSLGLVGFFIEGCFQKVKSIRPSLELKEVAFYVSLVLVIVVFSIYSNIRLRDYKSDISLFTKELQGTPDYREGLSVIALSYDRLKEYKKAEKFWKMAFLPNNRRISYLDTDSALTNYSANLIEQRRYNDAYLLLKDRIHLVKSNKAKVEARYNLAVAATFLGRFDESFPILKNYVENHPRDALAHYLLGWNAYDRKDFSLTLSAFEMYLELEPNAFDRKRIRSILLNLRSWKSNL